MAQYRLRKTFILCVTLVLSTFCFLHASVSPPLQTRIEFIQEQSAGTTLARVTVELQSPSLTSGRARLLLQVSGVATVEGLTDQILDNLQPFQPRILPLTLRIGGFGEGEIRANAQYLDSEGRALYGHNDTLFVLNLPDGRLWGKSSGFELKRQKLAGDLAQKELSQEEYDEAKSRLLSGEQLFVDGEWLAGMRRPKTAEPDVRAVVQTVTVSGRATYSHRVGVDSSGVFQYASASNARPIRRAIVRFVDGTTPLPSSPVEVFTDDDGRYTASVPGARPDGNAVNLRVVVYAIAKEVGAVGPKGQREVVLSAQSALSVVDSSTETKDVFSTGVSEARGAFSIQDWLLESYLYAEALVSRTGIGVRPSFIFVEYPGDNANGAYFGTNYGDYLNIGFDHAYDWDVGTHEYGHYIQKINDITKNPGGLHGIPGNSTGLAQPSGAGGRSKTLNKQQGISLAWGEGWPTFFGTNLQLGTVAAAGIYTAGDTRYTDTTGSPTLDYSLEANDGFTFKGQGEDDELSVQRILWDLADDDADGGDRVAYGVDKLWALVVSNHAYTLNDFLKVLNSDAISELDSVNYGRIFADHAIGPVPLTPANGSTFVQTVSPPVLTWTTGGTSGPVSSTYRFNNWVIKFFRGDFKGLLSLENIYTTNATAETMTFPIPPKIWGILKEVAGPITWWVEGSNDRVGAKKAVLTGNYGGSPSTFNINCLYALAPSPSGFEIAGGPGELKVTTSTSCEWTAAVVESGVDWITFDSPARGIGNATFRFSVSPNLGPARSARIKVADVTATISQDGPCLYTLVPQIRSVAAIAGMGEVQLTTIPNDCAWVASSNVSWLSVDSRDESGRGGRLVHYSYAANTQTSARTGTFNVQNKTFTLTQEGASCSYQLEPSERTAGVTGGAGEFEVRNSSACAWVASSNVSWISITSGETGRGNGTVKYSVSANNERTARTGTLSVQGVVFTVRQEGQPCTLNLSAVSPFTAAGGTANISVDTTPGCAWTAVSGSPWITIVSGNNGTGPGAVALSAAANTGTARVGGVLISMVFERGTTVRLSQIGPTVAWFSVGPAGSTIVSFALKPGNPTTVLAGASSAGIYRTTNAGASWATVNNGIPSTATVLALAFNPKNGAIVYAGTSGLGLFKSSDGGTNWSASSTGLTNPTVRSLAIDPDNPDVLYAGSNNGVFKSSNGGASWSLFSNGIPNDTTISKMALDPRDPQTLYAGTWFKGVFTSSNGGSNWTNASFGLGTPVTTAMAMDPRISRTLYLGTNGNGIFRTTNAGGNWLAFNEGLSNPIALSLATDPQTGVAFAGTEGSGVYTTGGGAWSAINAGLSNAVVRALAVDPETPPLMYAGVHGSGVFVTVPPAASSKHSFTSSADTTGLEEEATTASGGAASDLYLPWDLTAQATGWVVVSNPADLDAVLTLTAYRDSGAWIPLPAPYPYIVPAGQQILLPARELLGELAIGGSGWLQVHSDVPISGSFSLFDRSAGNENKLFSGTNPTDLSFSGGAFLSLSVAGLQIPWGSEDPLPDRIRLHNPGVVRSLVHIAVLDASGAAVADNQILQLEPHGSAVWVVSPSIAFDQGKLALEVLQGENIYVFLEP